MCGFKPGSRLKISPNSHACNFFLFFSVGILWIFGCSGTLFMGPVYTVSKGLHPINVGMSNSRSHPYIPIEAVGPRHLILWIGLAHLALYIWPNPGSLDCPGLLGPGSVCNEQQSISSYWWAFHRWDDQIILIVPHLNSLDELYHLCPEFTWAMHSLWPQAHHQWMAHRKSKIGHSQPFNWKPSHHIWTMKPLCSPYKFPPSIWGPAVQTAWIYQSIQLLKHSISCRAHLMNNLWSTMQMVGNHNVSLHSLFKL